MKIKALTISCGILAASLTATQAEGEEKKTFGNGTLPEFLAIYDVDESGDLNEEERQAARDARKVARAERRASIIAEFDLDEDGELNEEERQAARDAARAAIEAKRNERFAAADTDDSDGLSLAEFSAIPAVAKLAERRPEAVEKIFNRIDADDSGEIELDEFIAKLNHPPRHRRPAPPRPGQPTGEPAPAPAPTPEEPATS